MDSLRGPVHVRGTFWQGNYRHEIQKIKLNQSMTEFSNFSKAVWAALKNLKKGSNMVIKAADKSGAAIVWQTDLYSQDLQVTRQLTLWLRILPLYFYSNCQPSLRANKKLSKYYSGPHNLARVSNFCQHCEPTPNYFYSQNLPHFFENENSQSKSTYCFSMQSLHWTYLELFRQHNETVRQSQISNSTESFPHLQTDRPPQLIISFIFSSTKKEKNKGTEMPLS